MKLTNKQLWERFQTHYAEFPALGLAIDLSRMNFAKDFFKKMEPQMQGAFAAMAELEKGAIANPDENRMVGHYWLRNSSLAPTETIRQEITETLHEIKEFADQVHRGPIHGADGPFKNLLVIGIGGSALGPQFVSKALSHPATDKLKPHFFDNTDPDGIDYVLSSLDSELSHTLCLVISKSGQTKETRNGMLEAKAAYEQRGLTFASHAVAVTEVESDLDKVAAAEGWLKRFPMWDWVGGRTSEMSAVGLLPAALQGFNIDGILAGAEACDEITRLASIKANPAAQLALMWHHTGNGKGTKDMVILPYKDRLELFSRYLQQLVMESLGKELDIAGNVVNQGIVVYGNKGSTDQHAYIQQLREGQNNFFATFIEVLKDREQSSLEVEKDVTSGDYLTGFLLGTRQALHEKDRESITITIEEISPFSIGVLIALYERAVGLYASLVNINPYHQPGVEAGKKGATAVIELQQRVIEFLREKEGKCFTTTQIAQTLQEKERSELVFKICEHLAANQGRGIRKTRGQTPFAASYGFNPPSR